MRKQHLSIGILSLFMVVFVFFLGACSKNTLSERDTRLEQIRNNAENKRKELRLVEGDYIGLLSQPNGLIQNVSLKLEIKDIPYAEDGQVDPIMVPELTGYLRFVFGEEEGNEYIGFGMVKSEYDAKKKTLNLVVNNDNYKDIIMSLNHQDKKLTGTWTAPAIAASGSIEFKIGDIQGSGLKVEHIKGDYGGILIWGSENDYYQYSRLSLRTSIQAPEGLSISATVEIVYGDWQSTEFLTYNYNQVKYTPTNGELIIKSDSNDVMFQGLLNEGQLKGEWNSNYTGRLGEAFFVKESIPAQPTQGERLIPLQGSYLGKLENTHPESFLPEFIRVNFVTNQKLSNPGGIQITGKIRFYADEAQTNWEERDFSEVEYNFFTKKLTAKTGEPENLTLKLYVDQTNVSGSIFADGMGEIAQLEVVYDE